LSQFYLLVKTYSFLQCKFSFLSEQPKILPSNSHVRPSGFHACVLVID